MFDWEQVDKLSFDDSDRFEEDSLCSWFSEPESLCNNWRGWKKPSFGNGYSQYHQRKEDGHMLSLVELAARQVASNIPFELVEHVYPPVPEQLQLRIAFWSFPENEEDIRLYSCLANGNSEEFSRGDHLFKTKTVKDVLQIGFHLSAAVSQTQTKSVCNVAITFDRGRIISCNCTCSSTASWCSHVVAVCLHRIHQPITVKLRAPVSESLSKLHRDQLQKFAQYLISELPQQILPTAQRLLDELLSSQPSAINTLCGAPDPTAGASVNEQTSWSLDENTLHENIRKILIKFCVPSPMVLSDVNYLSNASPPACSEWTSLLRPLRGREPEGMWNLLSIVREMFRRADRNAIPLLTILTEECLGCEQILVWWLNTKVALQHGTSSYGGKNNVQSNAQASQHACSSLCDEIVVLWRLAALNPALSPQDREVLMSKFKEWHMLTLDKISKTKPAGISGMGGGLRKNDFDMFVGFRPAVEACLLDWVDYPIPGITYTRWCTSFCRGPIHSLKQDLHVSPVYSSQAVLNHQPPPHLGKRPRSVEFNHQEVHVIRKSQLTNTDGNRSSVSSEGFCETRDSDSDEGHAAAPRNREYYMDMDSDCSNAPDHQPFHHYVYHFDTKSPTDNNNRNAVHGDQDERYDSVFANLGKTEEPMEVPFARAEALHAHGHSREASKLAVKLAEELLTNPPNLSMDVMPQPTKGKRKKMNPYSHQLSCLTQATLSKAAFLCTVLSESPEHCNLAFRVGLFGLEMARLPASTKFLEVKLNHQESELVILLKRIPLCHSELTIIRERAEQLRDGRLRSRGEALLPLSLASFIFDVLVITGTGRSGPYKHNGDEELGFEASVAALGLKANVSEADHPLLCEGTRRQRAELAITLLVHYKDEQEKLAKIMDKLLDKEMHQQYKAPCLSAYYSTKRTVSGSLGPTHNSNDNDNSEDHRAHSTSGASVDLESNFSGLSIKAAASTSSHSSAGPSSRPKDSRYSVADREDAGSPTWVEDYKEWELKFRCTNFKTHKRHHSTNGMASIDSSAPETTSSDNSPTLVRRWTKPSGPGSDSGSSGNSSDSFESGSSGHGDDSQKVHKKEQMNSLTYNALRAPQLFNSENVSRTNIPTAKANRFKGKRAYPTLPNQPSEAYAYFMFELAKTMLNKAGGSSYTAMFSHATTSQKLITPHRALHMCAFQIGLYALGLHNCVSPNWLSRTYSSHVSWVQGQAIEIGAMAVWFMQETWEGHMTPAEVATLADNASRSRDPNMVRASAQLALSCLPHAQALNPSEILRAIIICKEQSNELLEKACLAVEEAAKGGGVNPEVLFMVARQWYNLYEEKCPPEERNAETEPTLDISQVVTLNGGHLLGSVNNNGVVSTVAAGFPHVQLSVPFPLTTFNFVQAIPPLLPTTVYLPQPPANAFTVQGFPNMNATPGSPLLPPPGPQLYGIRPGVTTATPLPLQPGHVLLQNRPGTPANMVGGQNCPPPVTTCSMPTHTSVPTSTSNQPHPSVRGSQVQLNYLLSAYRVGMLAMETLARRVHDDRPQAKYSRNPPYGDDVKWLLSAAKKLGTQYVQQLCISTVSGVVSPFILQEVALEAAQYLARSSPPSTVTQHLRNPILYPIVQKCQQMYIQCTHQKLFHITPADYEEFCSVVVAARNAFQMTPGGMVQFNELLQSLRRSKSCKKDLWQRVSSVLQQNGVPAPAV